jgi:hypothetical protein
MSVNKYQPHVLVLPEDDANLQIANGFHVHVPWNRQRRMQVLPVAGGWVKVLDQFHSNHLDKMESNSGRFMVLLIDLDGIEGRFAEAKARIPADLADRVFILSALTTPEALRQANLGPYEDIGSDMARDCREGTDNIWGHELLQHNKSELDRLRERVRPILFPSSE